MNIFRMRMKCVFGLLVFVCCAASGQPFYLKPPEQSARSTGASSGSCLRMHLASRAFHLFGVARPS
jgi:hypothetical protein